MFRNALIFGSLGGLVTIGGLMASLMLQLGGEGTASSYWLGYLIMRPEQHGLHHGRGIHAYNYGNFALWDMMFGTFRNPQSFPEQYGFWDGASARMDMIRASSRRRDDSAGFSLLGLLSVIVLMGVLAVISLAATGTFDPASPRVRRSQRTAVTGIPAASLAARAACALSASEIESAALAYYAGHEGQWPPDIATLTAPFSRVRAAPADDGRVWVTQPKGRFRPYLRASAPGPR